MAKNNKPLTTLFKRQVVSAPRPDSSWPLATELIGVEIEIENPTMSPHELSDEFRAYWTHHHDGSLRNGAEYVTSGPMGGEQLSRALSVFFNSGLRYDATPRTSIHIHINASDTMGVDDLRCILALMYVIEPAVFRWADEDRKWCGYCNPLTDMGTNRLIAALYESADDMSFIRAVNPGGNSDRYYGFNMAAFARHGTLEFRYFPCVTEESKVREWVKFVMMTKKAAVEAEDLGSMLGLMSREDTLRLFLNAKFGDIAPHILRNLDFADATTRARELLAATKVNHATLPPVRVTTARTRGFNQFLSNKFPNLLAGARDSAPSNALELGGTQQERQLAELFQRYMALSTGTTPELSAEFRNAAQTVRRDLSREVTRSSAHLGVSTADYIRANHFDNIFNTSTSTPDSGF